MQRRKRRNGLVFDAINNFLLFIIVIVTAYPLIYVAVASVSDPNQLLMHRGILLKPLGFSTEAYSLLLQNPMIYIGYRNTIFYLIVTTAICMVLTTGMAYALSRENVYWSNAIMMMCTFTMFFSGGMIPTFLVVKGLGMYNSPWSVILPGAVNTYNLIVMRTALKALPKSLDESAMIDGANHFTILTSIVIPLSLPVIAVITLYYAVACWNGWFNASIYLRNREWFPLQLVVREILLQSSTEDMTVDMDSASRGLNYSQIIKYAIIIVSTVPILFVYPFLQKYFTKGVLIGAIKG